MKNIKPTIESFLEEFNWEIREVIDNISGEIFQEFPNIKEKISNSKITYKHNEFGNFLELKVFDGFVHITHLKNKKSKQFQNHKEINLEELKLFFKITN